MLSSLQLPVVSGSDPNYGHMLEWKKDPLALFRRAANEAGDIAHLKFGAHSFYVVNSPEYIEKILIHQSKKFIKPALDDWRKVMGNGLVTAEGDEWARNRRLIQPVFSQGNVKGYADFINGRVDELCRRWQPGDQFELWSEMHKLTIGIVLRTFFNFEGEVNVEEITDAVSVVNDYAYNRKLSASSAHEEQFNDAVARLHAIFDRIIEDQRAAPTSKTDLISTLLLYEDDEGNGLSQQQIKDEVLTHLIAGYETTATSLTWTLYLLAKHPEAEAQLREEIARVLGDRRSTAADMETMPYTAAVFTETLRLFPISWTIARQSIEPFELGEYSFPEHTYIYMSPYIVQRNAELFDEPESFKPERWLSGLSFRLPKFAYFPFGGGPRLCIGRNLVFLEVFLVLTTLFQRYRLELDPEHAVQPVAEVTLYPQNGIRMNVHAI